MPVSKVSVLERVDGNDYLTSYFILELHLTALFFPDSFNCLTECLPDEEFCLAIKEKMEII